MNKLKVVSILGGIAMLLPMAASAATNITFINFPNSGPNATVAAGDSVDTKVTFGLTNSSELESMSQQIVDNNGNDIGMPEVCFDVADRVVAGTFTRTGNFDTTGGTEGTFGIRVRGYGVTGPGTDNNCGGTVNDNQYFSNRLTLTEDQNTGSNANNTGGGSSTNTGSSMPSWLAALIAVLKPSTPTTPTPSGVCASYAQAAAGAVQGVRNSANIRLQGFLLSQGAEIPALAAGASFGFFGPQTLAAQQSFVGTNHCN